MILIYIFGFSTTFSFVLTLLAMSIGHYVNPTAWIPQTLQMLLSNVIFDGLTMAATYYILKKALERGRLSSIIIAVVIDFIIAAFLAICSLFYGLVFTYKYLDPYEIFNILIFKSADGSCYEFGPYFWTMHTTFIPTLIYLGIILVACIGKLMLLLVEKYFDIGRIHTNPLKLTAKLFGIIAAFFLFLSLI